MLTTDFTKEQIKDIWDYYRMTQAYHYKIYDRIKLASELLSKKYHDISKMSFYKYLDRNWAGFIIK